MLLKDDENDDDDRSNNDDDDNNDNDDDDFNDDDDIKATQFRVGAMSKMGVNVLKTGKVNCFDAMNINMMEILSMLASYEYLNVEAALNNSITENNDDGESMVVLAKQLESLSHYKPGSNKIPMSRDELKNRIESFIKSHGILFSVEFLEDLKLKAEKL